MKRTLTLAYSLPTGRLAPHFEALAEGRALALCCDGCGHVAFPPALTCALCGETEGTWQPLSGQATLLQRSDTPDAAYGLVRFDGTETAAMVRLGNPDLTTRRGRLVPPETESGLWLNLEDPEDDDGYIR